VSEKQQFTYYQCYYPLHSYVQFPELSLNTTPFKETWSQPIRLSLAKRITRWVTAELHFKPFKKLDKGPSSPGTILRNPGTILRNPGTILRNPQCSDHRNLRTRTCTYSQVLQGFLGKEHLVKNPLISNLDKVIYFKGTIFQLSTKPLFNSQNRVEISW
jgi:hypothetical protein